MFLGGVIEEGMWRRNCGGRLGVVNWVDGTEDCRQRFETAIGAGLVKGWIPGPSRPTDWRFEDRRGPWTG